MTYNKTQLNPETTFEKHVYHRDQFAHYLRWTHVLKIARIGQTILDFGCGSGNMFEVFYRNRYKPLQYLGLDIRQQTIDKLNEKWSKLPYVQFRQADLCNPEIDYGNNWDIITCFEVIEHIGKYNAAQFLDNIRKHMNEKTLLLLSTPCYDEKVGAAANHIIDGKVGEFTYMELYDLLNERFEIVAKYGTFASQKDYKETIKGSKWEEFFKQLSEYYDSNLVSVMMAPFFPELSRNVLWKLKLKQ